VCSYNATLRSCLIISESLVLNIASRLLVDGLDLERTCLISPLGFNLCFDHMHGLIARAWTVPQVSIHAAGMAEIDCIAVPVWQLRLEYVGIHVFEL
jgi:hypothetical protein